MTQTDASLAGTVSLVMGASVGLGAAIAEALASRGAAVALAARRYDAVSALAAGIEAQGGQAIALACDVADARQVEAAVAATIARFGRLDHLVNNAGVIEPIGRFLDSDPALWARLIDINLLGAARACRAALPHLLAAKGVIVNISSGAAHAPREGWTAYCSSKAALAMLTQGLALEYGGEGVRVYGFAPGLVRTAMQEKIRASGINEVSRMPIEALQAPERPAAIAAWLCTPAAADWPSGECSIRDDALRGRAGIE